MSITTSTKLPRLARLTTDCEFGHEGKRVPHLQGEHLYIVSVSYAPSRYGSSTALVTVIAQNGEYIVTRWNHDAGALKSLYYLEAL